MVRGDGDEREYPVEAVLSSVPLPELIASLDPAPPTEITAAASRLRYRGLCASR